VKQKLAPAAVARVEQVAQFRQTEVTVASAFIEMPISRPLSPLFGSDIYREDLLAAGIDCFNYLT